MLDEVAGIMANDFGLGSFCSVVWFLTHLQMASNKFACKWQRLIGMIYDIPNSWVGKMATCI